MAAPLRSLQDPIAHQMTSSPSPSRPSSLSSSPSPSGSSTCSSSALTVLSKSTACVWPSMAESTDTSHGARSRTASQSSPGSGVDNPRPPLAPCAGNANSRTELAIQNRAADVFLPELLSLLESAVGRSSAHSEPPLLLDLAEAPECMPDYWISSWVDYADKYGVGYKLNDDSIGVLLNDKTNIACWQADQHLVKAGGYLVARKNGGGELERPPWVSWLRTSTVVVWQLSNGTVQINYLDDHKKLVLCPRLGSVALLDDNGDMRVYAFSLIQQHGCNEDLNVRLHHAKVMIVERLLSKTKPVVRS